MGDSLTDECEWSELLENPHIKNRGISGDTTMGVLNRLEDIVSSQPAKIFIMIGINNFIHYQRSAVEILVDYQKLSLIFAIAVLIRKYLFKVFCQSIGLNLV
ncbi:hypothetical protein [Chroococcidiopsis sp. SAG 2025]|uniref:hypothetical protein n=1 Tax=Chroococcidiopsis sp. SAG 2025 TaxID=171389 RepID=UPI002936FEBC|nr:hypothetical protein [Chroococcidiopsis sp. SAG 2025]